MTGVAIVIPMLNEAAGLPRVLRSLFDAAGKITGVGVGGMAGD